MIPIMTPVANATKSFLLAHIPYYRYAFYRLSLVILKADTYLNVLYLQLTDNVNALVYCYIIVSVIFKVASRLHQCY